ncbi:unnamed protein product [Euphydryas editha]|uniref:Uncharacterized protein n=1 Tax=Euphydryas editha TaxID=104508 RepID=A0AAU9UUJ9_EUPED|nr:unnamed protein product [Euphydryas editha]
MSYEEGQRRLNLFDEAESDFSVESDSDIEIDNAATERSFLRLDTVDSSFAADRHEANTSARDTKKRSSAPPLLEEEPPLSPTCPQETALSCLLDKINELAANIRQTVREGKSVTSGNKDKIHSASDQIIAAVDEIRALPPTPTTPTTEATPLDDLKKDIKGLSDEIAKLHKDISTTTQKHTEALASSPPSDLLLQEIKKSSMTNSTKSVKTLKEDSTQSPRRTNTTPS